jgi:hypothetical protein
MALSLAAVLSIDHTPPDCVLRDNPAKLVARVEPARDVEAVHVEVLNADAATTCWSEMKSDAPSFATALAAPGRGSERQYSIVAVDRAGGISRAGPFTVRVVAEPGACAGAVALTAPKAAVPKCRTTMDPSVSATPALAPPAAATATPLPPKTNGRLAIAPGVATCRTVHGQSLVTAHITPAANVAEARVYFAVSSDMCYVEMRTDGERFVGRLPARDDGAPPRFYVSARDRSNKEVRTAELRGSETEGCRPADDPATPPPFVPMVCPGGSRR